MSNEIKYPYSVHSFMLPLRWDYLPEEHSLHTQKSNYTFDTRTELKKFNTKIKDTAWERTFYKINNSPENYNENTYFHAYATYTLFDLNQFEEKTAFDIADNKTMVYYEIKCNNDDKYIICTLDKDFSLKLTGISLHVYNTGIAILTYNLENWSYKLQEDILKINEFGRRIYPQFLGNEMPYTNSTRFVFLAKKIEIHCASLNYGLPIVDDFTSYDSLEEKDTHGYENDGRYTYKTIIEIPQIVQKLFNQNFVYNAEQETKGDIIRFNILTDDRMFFQSWYGNNILADILKKKIKLQNGEESYEYCKNNFWYAFVFGDKSAYSLGIANKIMQERNLLDCTYDRWADYGTLFGFTRDSFVAVSSDVQTLLTNFAPDVRTHFKTMYYQMAVLCLAQRASVLRFSAEISSLSDLGKSKPKEITKRVQQLYLNYIEFINKIYFREITPQIQGIEVYNKFQKLMNIPNDVKDLDNEISELHQYVSLIQDSERNKVADKLNNMAAAFLPLSLIFGILGANFLSEGEMKLVHSPFMNAMLWIVIAVFVAYLIFKLLKKLLKITP